MRETFLPPCWHCVQDLSWSIWKKLNQKKTDELVEEESKMERHTCTVLISLRYLAKKHLSTEQCRFPLVGAEEESGQTRFIPMAGYAGYSRA